MDNNFWISAAIAAVVGGAWLFKKGKSAYSWMVFTTNYSSIFYKQ